MSPSALGVVSSARVASAAPGGEWSPLSIPGCQLWLDANQITGLADGADMAAWLDLSGNGRDFVRPSGSPSISFDATPPAGIVGNAAVDMSYASNLNSAAAFMSGKSSGEIFLVYRGQAAGDNTMWNNWGSDPNASHWPFTDGNVYDDWGSTARKSAVGTGLAPMVWHAISVHSAPNDWGINAAAGPLYATPSNTVGWASVQHTLVGGATHFAEIFIYDRKVSASERAAALAYLEAKWFPPTPTTPLPDIPNLQAWFDASDDSTFTLTGDLVEEWRDKSGAGHVVYAVSADKRPSRVSMQNGKKVLTFNFHHTKAREYSHIGEATQEVTVFAVCKRSAAEHAYNEIPAGLSGGMNGKPISGWDTTRYINTAGFPGYTDIRSSATLKSWSILTLELLPGVETSITEYLNGTQVHAHQTYYPDIPFDNQVISFGSRDDGATAFLGDIAEVLIYDRVLTESERLQVDAYLGAKWFGLFQFMGASPPVANVGTVATFPDLAIGAPHPDRVICVAIAANMVDSRTPQSVTIGGIPAIIDKSDGFGATTIAHATVPTGTTATVVVTYSATTGPGNGHCCAVYRATVPVTVVDDALADYVSNLATLTLDTVPDGAIIACMGSFNTSGAAVDWTNATEDHETVVVGLQYPSKTSSAHKNTDGFPTTITIAHAASMMATAVSFSGAS